MFFISPPFGNYICLPNTTRIYGSFTVHPRDGLWHQVFKTLRYSFKYNGWVNKIGLRNKGIDWALDNVPKEHILSIAIMHDDDIPSLLSKIPEDRNLEINISCPNVVKTSKGNHLGRFINSKREWCIVKLSPTSSFNYIDQLYEKGFRQFHCSNTVPIPEGGLSGISIQPYSISQLSYLKQKYPDTVLIGGGGITRWDDVELYRKKGADHFSVSTGFFHPFRMIKLYFDYKFK